MSRVRFEVYADDGRFLRNARAGTYRNSYTEGSSGSLDDLTPEDRFVFVRREDGHRVGGFWVNDPENEIVMAPLERPV